MLRTSGVRGSHPHLPYVMVVQRELLGLRGKEPVQVETQAKEACELERKLYQEFSVRVHQ